MRTPEQRRQRRTRRQVASYQAAHPVTPKAVDPLQNAVAYLATLTCDGRTKCQDRLSP